MAFRSWFPLSLSEQAAFYRNFTRVFAENAVALGFSAEDVAKLEADNAVMQFLAQMQLNIKVFKRSFQSFRDNMTKGLSENTEKFTPFKMIDIPTEVEPNMFDRLFYLSDRIVGAKGYEESLGIRLGILPPPKKSLIVDELEPKLKARSIGQANLEVRFVRGKTSGVNLYYIHSNDDRRHDLGRFIHSPAIVRFPLIEEDKPEQILLFARYLIGNDAVGKFSPMIELIVAP